MDRFTLDWVSSSWRGARLKLVARFCATDKTALRSAEDSGLFASVAKLLKNRLIPSWTPPGQNALNLVERVEHGFLLAGVLSLFRHSQFDDKLVTSRRYVLYRHARANEASRGLHREIGLENRVLPTVARRVDVRHVVAGDLQGELMCLQRLSPMSRLANKLPIAYRSPNTVPER
jgi:hypothetical protein